jgi:hypothetical protein
VKNKTKRLLIATAFPPNGSGGGAAIVRQMLRGWPKENLFWWSCEKDIDHRFGQNIAAHEHYQIPSKLIPHKRLVGTKTWMLKNLWAPHAATHLEKTIKKIRPDIIWAIPHQWSILPLAKVLPGSGIRYHVSMHDYADASCNAPIYQKLSAQADHLYTMASSRDVISQPMVEDLYARTGLNGFITRAGLEEDDFDYLRDQNQKLEGRIRIAYAGTIIVEEEFVLFIDSLKRIRANLKQPVSLELFGAHSYKTRPWFEPSWMKEHGNLTIDKLSAELKTCSWGFAPMSLNDDQPRYNRYSLPTKIGSYLSAGLPLIIMGHPDSCIIKTLEKYDLGPKNMTSNGVQIDAALVDAFTNVKVSGYTKEIERCSNELFNGAEMRSRLKQLLMSDY